MRALLLALLLAAGAAQAQSWPAKPVRFVVPYPPGGSTDLTARTLAERLTRSLGQQVVVENRAGAAGAIGTSEVARAAPDGYTILFAADTVITLHLVAKVQFDMQRDFAPITLATIQPIAVAVHPSLGVNSVQELIAYGKANPASCRSRIPVPARASISRASC
jgi:tripartite-type tricarboxylate transporter receptor subunit TctC